MKQQTQEDIDKAIQTLHPDAARNVESILFGKILILKTKNGEIDLFNIPKCTDWVTSMTSVLLTLETTTQP